MRSSDRRKASPGTDGSDQEDESLVLPSPSRNTRQSKRQRAASSDESAGSEVDADDMGSEESEAQGLEDPSDEDEGAEPPHKKQRQNLARRPLRGKAKASYLDPSSSEFDSDEADDDGDDESDESETSRSARRGRGTSTKKKPAKRSNAKKPPKKKLKQNGQKIPVRPTVAPWPEIALKHITEVGQEIVQRLGDVDEDGLFAIPVAEALPDLADEYRDKIEEPMDFRTIVEERLPRYRSIRELQLDLVTIFHNCIVFNGAKHEYGRLAQ